MPTEIYPVRLVALRPLYGEDYGKVDERQIFTTTNIIAERLEAKGWAYRHFEPKPFIPKSVTAAPKNKAIEPQSAVTVANRPAKTYSTK